MKKNGDHNIVAPASKKEKEFVLRLFVTGASPNSVKAINNIKEICELHISGKYSLEIIDIYRQDSLIKEEQVVALPLLIRKFPLPEKRLIGDMSVRDKVLKGLGLTA